MAAKHLQRCCNFEDAVAFHERLAAALPREAVAKKVKSLVKLSEMHEFLWDLRASEEKVTTILEIGKDLVKPRNKITLYRRLASLAISRNDNVRALQMLQEARGYDDETLDEFTMLSLDAPEAWALWFNGEQDKARQLLERAEATAIEIEPTDVRQKINVVSAQNYIANLHHQIGDVWTAAQLQRRNLELLDGLNLEQAEAACLCSLGGALLDGGKHEEAKRFLLCALDKGKAIADRRTLTKVRERLGEYHLLHGDLKQALQMTQVGLEEAKSINHLSGNANNQRMLGRIYMRADQIEDAIDALKMAVSIHAYSEDVTNGPLSQISIGELYLQLNQTDNALKQLTAALKHAETHGLVLATGLAKLCLAGAKFCKSGEMDTGLLDEAWNSLRYAGHRRATGDVALLRSRWLLRSGDRAGAKKLLHSLSSDLESVGSTKQKVEARYLDALIVLEEGRTELGLDLLRELETFCSNTLFRGLAKRCAKRIATAQVATAV